MMTNESYPSHSIEIRGESVVIGANGSPIEIRSTGEYEITITVHRATHPQDAIRQAKAVLSMYEKAA